MRLTADSAPFAEANAATYFGDLQACPVAEEFNVLAVDSAILALANAGISASAIYGSTNVFRRPGLSQSRCPELKRPGEFPLAEPLRRIAPL
jgi:hypothetical protein